MAHCATPFVYDLPKKTGKLLIKGKKRKEDKTSWSRLKHIIRKGRQAGAVLDHKTIDELLDEQDEN